MELPPELSNCLCDISECKECRGKVCLKADGKQYLHIKVNGCLEISPNLKRADCVILHPIRKDRIHVFIIGVKTRHYDLDEVKEKMENTLKILDGILNCSLVPFPVIYAESHGRSIKRYALVKKIEYKGKRYLIDFRKYCEDIREAECILKEK